MIFSAVGFTSHPNCRSADRMLAYACSVGRPTRKESTMIRRGAYGLAAYIAFTATFLYTMGFLANSVVPKGIDDGPIRPAWQAILIDAALLGIFAVQHTVMARP